MKRISYSIILSVVFLATSCSHKWKSYTIKAGDHSKTEISTPFVEVNEIEFLFRTNDSWYYSPPSAPGWNKIRGFSHGHHRDNSSARLGYQCLNDTLLVVGGYCYANGVSPQDNPSQKGIIDTISSNSEYRCRIKWENGKYKFYFEDKYWESPGGTYKSWGYKLNPYIGGSFVLDHDWYTQIKDLKP
jgi:hypothetical protein